MIWLSRPDGSRTFFNRAWLDFTGRTLADQLGAGWARRVHHDDRAQCVAKYAAAVAARQRFDLEYRLRRADGEFRWVIDLGAPHYGAHHKLLGYIGSCVDITDRKRAELALRASETRFRLLAENAHDMIYRYRVQPAFGMDYLSPAATAMTGHAPEEFSADPELPFRIIHPDDRAKAQLMRQDPEGFREPVILRWVHADGRIVHIEHRNTPVYDGQGRLVAIEGIGRDVTEQVAIEHRLRDSEAHMRRLAANLELAREQERANVSRELHDELGQTLTAVKIELARVARELLKQGIGHESLDRLQSIIGGVDLATETVRRLAAALRPPALDHLGLVAAIELEAAAVSRRTGLRCRVVGNRRADNLNPQQATALFRIVQEALTNVVRHASASAVSIWINGSTRATSLKIQDNGVGMTNGQQNGAGGIGLLGMRERTEQIAGTLTITSRPGRGTAIRVVAPASRTQERADL